MANVRRRRRLLLVGAIGLAVVAALEFGPALITVLREGPRLRQRIPPLDLEGVAARDAVDVIVAGAIDPVPVALCADRASRPVALHYPQGTRMDTALQDVASQLGLRVSWYISIDPGSVGRAYPWLRCSEPGGRMLTRSTQGAWNTR